MTQPPPTADESHASREPPPPPPPHHSGERSVLVAVGITMAALLFVATAGLLYLRWATMREPMCVLIVQGTESLRGAEVTVEGIGLPKPHVVTMGAGERFGIPFYLDYGTYGVRVTMNQETIVDTEVTLTRETPGRLLDLSKLAPPTMPAGAARRAGSTSGPSTAPTLAPRARARVWTPADEWRDLPALTPTPEGSRLAP